MSNVLKALMSGGAAAPLYVDDVFSAYLRSGTGASATVTTNIDLSTYGGTVWTKARSAATGHRLTYSAIGVQTELLTESTAASAAATQGVTAISTTGHTVGTDTDYNNSTGPVTYVDWVFRNSDRFYGHTTVTKSAGSDATASFPGLGTLGMVRVKRTDSTGSWYVWHRSLTAGKLLIGETTAAESPLGHITVSGTTVTLVNGVIADGSYLVEAFAHDTAADGIIQCGSFLSGSGTATVTLGWEPQFIMYKPTTTTGDWRILDVMRGLTANNSSASTVALAANLSNAENNTYSIQPTATGVQFNGNISNVNDTYIYLAIRRPNKPPTSGTQVYSGNTSSAAAGTALTTGFSVDMQMLAYRGAGDGTFAIVDRLRGVSTTTASSSRVLKTPNTTAEAAGSNTRNWNNTGFEISTGTGGYSYIYESFRRAPGVFDVVCYTGTGIGVTQSINHSLGVAPELIIYKSRNNSGANAWYNWLVLHSPNWGNYQLLLNTTGAESGPGAGWPTAAPSATQFYANNEINQSANTYVAYLFATKAGISKVGSYTGNGSSQTINCGFSAGARFVLIKRTDSTGDWFVWDTVRGIVAGNDPHLSLNTTAAEVTTDDSIDPDNSGFIVNQLAATNININGAEYLYLAYA